MSYVVIDTNILYSLTGISVNPKVQRSDITKHNLATTTATLIEVIVKQRENLITLKACLKPVVDRQYTLISVGHAPLDSDKIKSIFYANDLTEIECILKEIISTKICREAEFLRFILIAVVIGMLEIMRSQGYSFKDSSLRNKQSLLTRAMLEGNFETFEQYFRSELTMGYEKGNEQKVALESFRTKLLSLLEIFVYNFHMLKTGCFPGENNEKSKLKACKASFEKDDFRSKFAVHLTNPVAYISKKKNEAAVDRYLKQVNNELIGDLNITSEALNYLMQKMEALYKRKSKFQKNDIFDFFIIFCLHLPGTRLATLDRKFLTVLKAVDPKSHQLCESLGFAK